MKHDGVAMLADQSSIPDRTPRALDRLAHFDRLSAIERPSTWWSHQRRCSPVALTARLNVRERIGGFNAAALSVGYFKTKDWQDSQ